MQRPRIRSPASRSPRRADLALAVAALVLAVALAVPLRLSADVWAYAAYGALLAHGIDPWAHAYVWPRSLHRWEIHCSTARSPRGKARCRATSMARSSPCRAPRSSSRCAAQARRRRSSRCARWRRPPSWRASRSRARTRPRLAALLAVHPVVLWTAAEGHNDAIWLALVLAGDGVRAGRPRTALLTAAALVKAVAIVPLASALTHAPRRVWTAALALLALAAGYAPLLWSLAANGLDHGAGPPRLSLVHAPALAAWSGSSVPLVIGAVLAGTGAAAVARAWRSGEHVAAATLLGWLLLPAPEPWYALWLLPIIAMVGRSPAASGLLAATFCGAAGYVQDAVPGTALQNPALLGGTMLALYALPLLLAVVGQVPQPEPQPQPVPPTPPPLVSPSPSPAATTSPIPATMTPVPTATPSPNPTASLFSYVVDPPGTTVSPRIVEIAINDRTLHQGQMLLVKITTSPDVTALFARTMGHQIGIPNMSPGVFAGQQQLPSGIPGFLSTAAIRSSSSRRPPTARPRLSPSRSAWSAEANKAKAARRTAHGFGQSGRGDRSRSGVS